MAVAIMTSINISEYTPKIDLDVYEYEESITGDAADGDTVLLPESVQYSSVGLICSGGASGKVQATTSILSKVRAETANWIDWPASEVISDTQDILEGATAIRMVKTNASGTLTMELRSK